MATFFNGRIKTTKIEEGVYTVITGILDGQKTVVARALTENQAAVDRVEAGVVELLLE